MFTESFRPVFMTIIDLEMRDAISPGLFQQQRQWPGDNNGVRYAAIIVLIFSHAVLWQYVYQGKPQHRLFLANSCIDN